MSLRTLSYQDIDRLIKTKELSYYNIYNADIPITTYYATQYYLRYQHDTMETPQILNKLFVDIEVFADEGIDDFSEAKYPINAVTLCSNIEKVFHSFLLLNSQNFQGFGITADPDFNFNNLLIQRAEEYRQILIKEGYIDDTYRIQLNIFNDESNMIQAFWNKVHELDPEILSGWNSDTFDFPYLYNRSVQLFGVNNAVKLISKFDNVTVKDNRISIPEFTIVDLLYLYKPRDEGGLVNSSR